MQELEELVEGYKIELMIKDNAKKRANQQNKRYREALEKIRSLYPLRNVGYQLSEIRKIVIEALEGESDA